MKHNFLRRTGAIFLTLVMALSLAVTPAMAVEGEPDGGDSGENPPTPTVPVTGITVSPTETQLEVGKTIGLGATITPANATSKNVEWSTSDSSVATVDSNGVVTAQKEGVATITVTAVENSEPTEPPDTPEPPETPNPPGGGETPETKADETEKTPITATCKVTVVPTAKPVTNIDLSKYALIFDRKTGSASQNLIATVQPDGANNYEEVEWVSDNTSVVTVEKRAGVPKGTTAVVKPVGPGEANVKASAGGVESEVCKVTVSGITLEETELEIKEGRTAFIDISGTFGDASGSVSWTSSNVPVAEVNESTGKITAHSVGNAIITANRGGYTATCRVTVVEDTTGLIDAGTIKAGTPMKLSKFKEEISRICKEETESDMSYVTNLSVPTVQGIVHNGYIAEGDTGSGVGMTERFYYTPSAGQASMDNLYFVPSTEYGGVAEIKYVVYSTNNQSVSGIIRVKVTAMEDVNYVTGIDTPVSFESSHFNNVCRTRMGRDLNYVTFTLPNSKDGTLYYDYRGTAEYATKVTSTTHYKRSGSPYLDNISFVPAKGFTGDVVIDYRGIDTSGAAYNGKLTITVSDRSVTEAGDINYRTPKDTEVSFITRDFTGILDRGTLDYIRFDTLPTSSQGSLRYDYRNSSNTGTAVTTSQRYFRTGSQNLIADLSFIPARDFEGQVKLEFTAYNTAGEPFSGIVSIEVGETTGGRTVRYEVGSGRSVRFVAADFNEACLGVLNKPITRIQFEDLPSSSRGTLYLNYNSSTGRGTAVKSKTNYYYNSSPRISDLTFVSNGGYSGTVRVGFTGYTDGGETFTGTLEIMVSAGTPNVTYYSTTNAGTVRLNGSTLSSACSGVMSNKLSYIQFTGLPASSAGHLYRNYNGFNTGTQVSTGTQYYVNGTPSIDQLTFVPRNTFQGVASLSYTGFSTSGEQVSGRIDITVSNGGITSSFNDMGGYSWATASVNYLASNGVVNGIGNGNYGPSLNIHRCDFVVMLCRAFGFNAGNNESGFDDVPGDSYYSQAVATAKRLGIVSGTGGNSFSPHGQLTRQDGILMVRNALSVAGWSISSDPSVLDSFEDGGTVSSYARNAVSALVQLGVVSGDSNGRLRPHDPITRAELAVLLHHIMTM